MPVKVRKSKRPQYRITDEAVEAFARGDQMALHRALNLRPWHPSPLQVDGPEPPDWGRSGTGWHDEWPVIWPLRQELERRLAERG